VLQGILLQEYGLKNTVGKDIIDAQVKRVITGNKLL
jgi:hypothetical protein